VNESTRPYLVSIVVVSKDNYKDLQRTISSIFYALDNDLPIEIIVIDGSNHPEKFSNKIPRGMNLTYLQESDAGIFSAMNKGMFLAKGRFIWFLNSGDILPKDINLISLLGQLKSNNWLVGNAMKEYRSIGRIQNWKIPKKRNLKLYFAIQSFPHQSTIYRTDLLVSQSGFNESSPVADWETSLKFLLQNSPKILPATLSICEGGGNSSKLGILVKTRSQVLGRKEIYGFGGIRFTVEYFIQLLINLVIYFKYNKFS
jgi:glycosyltransferase involved in cell wall biosynthesis